LPAQWQGKKLARALVASSAIAEEGSYRGKIVLHRVAGLFCLYQWVEGMAWVALPLELYVVCERF
jgi:hypothetical protein